MDSLSCRFLSPWKQLSGLPSRRSDTQKSDASRCALLGSSRTPLFLSNFSSRTHFAKERKASLHHIPKAIARLSASATSLVPSTSEIEVQDKSNEDSGPAEVKRLLLGLRNGALGQPELALPVTLTKKDRLVAHEWAEKLGLGHESQGTGKERRLTANRLGAKDRLEKYKEVGAFGRLLSTLELVGFIFYIRD